MNETIIVNNDAALIAALVKRLDEAWAIVDKQKLELADLKAQVKILKEVLKEANDYSY
jgi:Flp pilus assembly protein TadD